MKYLKSYNESTSHHKRNAAIKEILELNLEGVENLSIESIKVNTMSFKRNDTKRESTIFDVDIEENFTGNSEISNLIKGEGNDACDAVNAINRDILNKIARKYDFTIKNLSSDLIDDIYIDDEPITFNADSVYFHVNFTITMNEPIKTNEGLFDIFKKKPKVEQHQHDWKFQYSTGNPTQGKSQVCKCDCGQWAVRHYGDSEYTLLKESVFSNNNDETFIKDAINAIKSGEVKVRETGGGRAPMARRSYYLYHFDFGDKHICVEQPTDANILNPKISVWKSDIGPHKQSNTIDINPILKRRLLSAVKNVFDEYGNQKPKFKSTKHDETP